MKHTFNVEIYFLDGSSNSYNVVADDDVEGREKAVKIDRGSYWDGTRKPLEIDFCNIKEICTLDD